MATSASPYPSPASSTSSLTNTPSSSPAKPSTRANPHPYPIKTTSTGILTRSNSTHSTNSAQHHYVPSSPRKQKINKPRHSGHKYSHSLNTELPRPLPVPPSAKTESNPQDGSFVSRRERRSDTMPSMSQPNLLLNDTAAAADELPHDPRTWTPAQLSTYLRSSLRLTSGDLPPLVSLDIATFVRTQGITGRKFLRLTEGDLDKYGLNQRWQTALLGASRALRQGSLRGRIWSSAFSPDQDADQEDESESLSSTSSSDSFSEIHRDRFEKSRGRVKGMVASFEHSGPLRSDSPSKDSGHNSLSPVKRLYGEEYSPDSEAKVLESSWSRPRPHSDIFPSRSPYAMNPSTDEGLPAVTATTSLIGDIAQTKEPRRLPYPPPAAQILPDYTAFNASPPPQVQGLPSFSAFGSPQLSSPEPSFTPFPSGTLPFSPQSTGSTLPSPDHLHPTTQINPEHSFVSAQPLSFDALYTNTISEGVRPLPLPPHPGQFYQPLSSASVPQGYQGVVMTDDNNQDEERGTSSSLPLHSQLLPHGLGESVVPVPHVQVQHVPDSGRGHPFPVQAPSAAGLQPTLFQQQQSDSIHYLPPQFPQAHLEPPQPIPIFAPQPRHGGGRESPTKILEEKLEELLEPRPRSRVFPGQPSISRPHSRVQSTSNKKERNSSGQVQGQSLSRPGSRVASMNLAAGSGESGGGGSLTMGNGTISASEENSRSNGNGAAHNSIYGGTVGVGNSGAGNALQHPRTRVISLSSRTHSHRLSGVEAWGESHRHIVVPSDEDLGTLHTVEVGGVKELEGEEEVGIEALLEQEAPTLPIPDVSTGGGLGGHGKESSSGSTGSGTIVHSRNGSLREPKSSVITVVEKKPSTKFRKKNVEEEGQEAEESMEALLAKADSHSGSMMMKKPQGLKRRMPLSGAVAWENVNIETVKHVEGDGMNKSIEDIFPAKPLPPATVATSVPHGSRLKQTPSPRQSKARLRLRSKKSVDDSSETIVRLEELEKKEKELESSVCETRKMVEEVKGRLENVERWIAESERKALEKQKIEESQAVWSIRSVLSASGVLGLSAWFSASSSVSSTSSSATGGGGGPQPKRMALIRRIARFGWGLSTYAVLLGIGICVMLLRALGKRPGIAARLGNVGVGARFWNGGNMRR